MYFFFNIFFYVCVCFVCLFVFRFSSYLLFILLSSSCIAYSPFKMIGWLLAFAFAACLGQPKGVLDY